MLYCHKLAIFPNNEIRSSVVALRSPASTPVNSKRSDDVADPHLTLGQYSTRAETPATTDFQNPRKKAGYGREGRQSGFSLLARRTLLRAGGALQRSHPVNECLFLTMTLPGSSIASFRALAEWSAYAVQHLKNWIGKRVSSNLSLYVWEWQKRGALHLHYVVHVPDENARQYIQDGLHAQWIRILDAICTNSGVDIYAKSAGFTHADDKSKVQSRAEICKFSVAGYLAKYLSKGSSSSESPKGKRFYPARWYGVSRPLHALIAEYTEVVEVIYGRQIDALRAYEDSLSLLYSTSVQAYSYRHGSTQFRTTIGYFKTKEIEAIWSMMTSKPIIQKTSPSKVIPTSARLISQGTRLMKASAIWQKNFYGLSSPYVHRIIQGLERGESIGRHDAVYLLDTLAYSLRYSRKTGMYEVATQTVWYNEVRSFITAEVNQKSRPYRYGSDITECNKKLTSPEGSVHPGTKG